MGNTIGYCFEIVLEVNFVEIFSILFVLMMLHISIQIDAVDSTLNKLYSAAKKGKKKPENKRLL